MNQASQTIKAEADIRVILRKHNYAVFVSQGAPSCYKFDIDEAARDLAAYMVSEVADAGTGN